MAIAAPRIAILLDERRAGIEWIATLRTEEVPGVPLRATSNDDLALDGCFARFAARAEHFVEVQRAVEAHRGHAVGFFGFVELVVCDVVRDVASMTGCDAF